MNLLERNLTGLGRPRAVVVDQQIAGDRDQPSADGRPPGIEAIPRSQRPLKRLLGQVLGIVPAVQPVGEERVDAREVVVVCLFELQSKVPSRAPGPYLSPESFQKERIDAA